MLAEIGLFGTLASSLLIYFVVALGLFIPLTMIAGRCGFDRLPWRPPLARFRFVRATTKALQSLRDAGDGGARLGRFESAVGGAFERIAAAIRDCLKTIGEPNVAAGELRRAAETLGAAINAFAQRRSSPSSEVEVISNAC